MHNTVAQPARHETASVIDGPDAIACGCVAANGLLLGLLLTTGKPGARGHVC